MPYKTNLYLRGEVWWCWFYDAHGNRVRKSTHQKDRALAKKAARQLEKECIEAPPGQKDPITLSEALATYLANAERRGRSEATLSFYVKKSNALIKILGADTDVTALALKDIEGYMDVREEEGVSLATVGKELITLRAALNYLHKQRENGGKLYENDPNEIIPEGVCGTYTPRERSLPHEEYLKLYAALSADRRDYLHAFCGLGVRDSELPRICPEHLDQSTQRVAVPGTKTDEAKRFLQPPRELFEMLLRRAEGRQFGEPLFPFWSNMRRDLAAACRRAKIEKVTPNDLRRTFATWQAEAGVPELVTAALMGHTTSAMVRKVYAKIGDQAKRDALASLPALIASSVTKLPGRKRTALRNQVRAANSTVTDVVTDRVENRVNSRPPGQDHPRLLSRQGEKERKGCRGAKVVLPIDRSDRPAISAGHSDLASLTPLPCSVSVT